jgi:hypothetical protein
VTLSILHGLYNLVEMINSFKFLFSVWPLKWTTSTFTCALRDSNQNHFVSFHQLLGTVTEWTSWSVTFFGHKMQMSTVRMMISADCFLIISQPNGGGFGAE